MHMNQYLAELERQTPGFMQRVWEQNGRGYTFAHDARCAQAINAYAKLRGDQIEITPTAWADYRHELGMVSRQRKVGLAEIPEAAQAARAMPFEEWLGELQKLRGAIERLTAVLEAREHVYNNSQNAQEHTHG